MIYAEECGVGDQHSDNSESTPTVGVAVSVDYWVVDEAGDLADPARVASLPGADRTDSPYSITVETPVCGSCDGLRVALCGELQRALGAAAERDCRLLAVGVRPDQIHRRQRNEPPPETAGTRVRFETGPETATTVYNVLLALDPVFVLLSSTCEDGPSPRRRAALVDEDRPAVQGYRAARPTTERVPSTRQHDESTDHWQPVVLVDEVTVEWRTLASSTPTLLVDLIGDVLTVLRQATECRIEVGTFGNGFEVGCLSLPTAAWRQRYLSDAVTDGLQSVRLRAYLERLGFATGWYLQAQPQAVSTSVDGDRRAMCRQRAELLAADA